MIRSYKFIIITAILCMPITGVSASSSSERGDSGTKTSAHHTADHPPHDHQHNDHLKKLNEGMRRKNKKLN